MNRLNTIKFSLVFLLLIFVFTPVSYADWTEIPNSTKATNTYVDTTDTIAGYTIGQIRTFFKSTDKEARNTMLNAVSDAGYYVAWLPTTDTSYYTYIYSKDNPIDIGANVTTTGYIAFYPFFNEGTIFYNRNTSSSSTPKKGTCTSSGYVSLTNTLSFKKTTFDSMIAEDENAFGSIPYIKTLLNNSGYYWNGEYYFYRNITPDEPTFPTNQEIANAVQKFYNSDIYKNNTNFKDFMVVYSSLKNTYAFIGTDNHMLQEIYYDGVEVPSVNFSYSDTWWRFNSKFGDIQSFLFGYKYYLYFIEGNSDVITNEGTGTLYDLFELKFTTGMTIVYSTYDYDVIEYRPPAEGEIDNQVTRGTIEGDSYTYDENVNLTDSQYSPLQNFVSSNSAQSILNDVDFDSVNKAFEDGKVILNIENATWLFTANNQLVDYFIGFIIFIIILLVISRVLGG